MANKVNHVSSNNKIEFQLNLLVWEEEHLWFIYSPELDLTGYSDTAEVALASFNISLEEFTDHAAHKNTFYKELKKLGWAVNKKKRLIGPPKAKQLLIHNNTYKELLSKPGVLNKNTHIGIELL